MAKATETAKQMGREAKQTAEDAVSTPWVDGFARFGYIIRGVLYAVVGLLAVQVALGAGGKTTDKNGAISTIGSEPFGKVLLVLVLLGLVGYSLWGFIRAILDPLHRGTDAEGIAKRLGYVVSGLSYGALIVPTVQYILGVGKGGESNGSQDIAGWLLAQPFGSWLLGILGLIGIGGGLGQLMEAFKAGFKKDLKTREMSKTELEWAERVGRFGHAARGVVFALLGFFIVQAALNSDPKKAQGLDDALRTLAQQPYGPWLLGIVALGLISFGIFSMLCARWMHVTRS